MFSTDEFVHYPFRPPIRTKRTANILFDQGHGQKNWAQTGFLPRSIDTLFTGFIELLVGRGFSINTLHQPFFSAGISTSSAIIIPPPTGQFDFMTRQWDSDEKSLFSGDEIAQLVHYVNDGGRLLAFAYRFGDHFTKTNIGSIFAALGWTLNNDAIVDAEFNDRLDHPLDLTFVTPASSIHLPWASAGVNRVTWRPLATLTPLPGISGKAIVTSPPSHISINIRSGVVSSEQRPICVAGTYGAGKYILAGGPHAFENAEYGLLDTSDNRRFADNLITWLLGDEQLGDEASPNADHRSTTSRSTEVSHELWGRAIPSTDPAQADRQFIDLVSDFFSYSDALDRLALPASSTGSSCANRLLFVCKCDKPLWARSRGIVVVDCAGHQSIIDDKAVTRFAEQLNRNSGKIGFIAGWDLSETAWAEVRISLARFDILIGVLDRHIVSTYFSGLDSVDAILEKSLVRSATLF